MADSYYPFFLLVFSLFLDKHFETDERISCRTDESITLFVTQFNDWYCNGLDEFIFLFLVFFLEKTAFLISFFVYCNVTQLKYFWWNYFLNNFCLLIGLLRLVCLLDGRYIFIMISDPQQNTGVHFWWNMFFSNTFYIVSHKAAINFLVWTSFPFFPSDFFTY